MLPGDRQRVVLVRAIIIPPGTQIEHPVAHRELQALVGSRVGICEDMYPQDVAV